MIFNLSSVYESLIHIRVWNPTTPDQTGHHDNQQKIYQQCENLIIIQSVIGTQNAIWDGGLSCLVKEKYLIDVNTPL